MLKRLVINKNVFFKHKPIQTKWVRNLLIITLKPLSREADYLNLVELFLISKASVDNRSLLELHVLMISKKL